MRYENELFDRWTWKARRPNDLARNPHESQRRNSETEPHVRSPGLDNRVRCPCEDPKK